MAQTADGYLSDVRAVLARAAADDELPADEYRRLLDEVESDAGDRLEALDDDEPDEGSDLEDDDDE